MEPYDIEYNRETATSHGVVLYDYAHISGGEKVYDTYSIPGAIGEAVSEDKYKENLSIECVFSVASPMFMPKMRDLKSWLTGTGHLIISDDPGVFYKVWKINYGDISREIRKFGTFSVSFVCTPYLFTREGQMETEDLSWNPGDTARPIYKIKGNGTATLTVNGKEMKATVNGDITIDTERMIAYNASGASQNTALSGDYEDLFLQKGENSVSITSGFTLSAIPQWGYDV